MSTIINSVGLHLLQVNSTAKYSRDTQTKAVSLIVEIKSGDITGWGEVFLPDVDIPWQWTLRVTPMLINKDAEKLDNLIDEWPKDRKKLPKDVCVTYCHPDVDMVAEAVSIALHDLVAKTKGIRFCELLGQPKRTKIPGMPVITLTDPEKMAEQAIKWQKTGCRYLKVKLSGKIEYDNAILKHIYKNTDSEIELQVDANGAYPDMESAKPIIKILNRYNIAVIEDLFDIGQSELCIQAKEQLKGKYMVDKDAHWPAVKKVLQSGAADIINQHPHNQGRMSYAIKISEAAHSAGIENAVGSSGIFGIQNTAFQHLAGITGLTRPCEDIGLHHYFDYAVKHSPNSVRTTILADPVPFENGFLTLPDKPGLGVTVDRDLIKRFQINETKMFTS
jgi:L-alanine-DL-glutamate epimerase-like enolase superfamily enzyme